MIRTGLFAQGCSVMSEVLFQGFANDDGFGFAALAGVLLDGQFHGGSHAGFNERGF